MHSASPSLTYVCRENTAIGEDISGVDEPFIDAVRNNSLCPAQLDANNRAVLIQDKRHEIKF